MIHTNNHSSKEAPDFLRKTTFSHFQSLLGFAVPLRNDNYPQSLQK